MIGRSQGLLLTALGATLPLARRALAATGDLTPQGCIDDHSVGQGPDDCGAGNIAPGLNGVTDVAVSPDGRSVYAVSPAGGENTVAWHTFEVRARDAAGNVDQSPAKRSFKVKRKKKRK